MVWLWVRVGWLAPRLGACYILSAFDKLAVALRKVRAAAAAAAAVAGGL